MTTPSLRSRLITPDDVDHIFDSAAVRRLAEIAKLPAGANLNSFGISIQNAARQYLDDAATPSPKEHRENIKALAKLVREAIKGDPDGPPWLVALLIGMLGQLEPATRHVLDECAYPRNVPTADELMHPEHGRKALRLLYGLLHKGAKWKPGRKRPGGKQSHDTLQGEVVGPRVERGRPSNTPEFMLCTWLGITYFKATEKQPPLRVAKVSSRQIASPFGRLVHEVFVLLGTDASAVKIIRKYGEARCAAKERIPKHNAALRAGRVITRKYNEARRASNKPR